VEVEDQEIEETGLNVLEYNKRWAQYRLKLQDGDITQHYETIKELLKTAYERRNAG
jgi:hypothetical protein